MAHWYETLFANFAKTYDKECFTQGTVGEVDFVERELGGDRSKRILDIACGTGRHAIELGKRGYHVVGFDLSEGQLRVAREKAAAAGVSVEFQQRDATLPHFHEEFDAALMLCEGAFPLMETDERFYTPAEMSWLLKTAGFASLEVFGCHTGHYSRQHALTTNDFEMLVVAEKGT